MTNHTTRRPRGSICPRPSKELAAWFGPSYRPSDEPITPQNYEPHPWPAPTARNRQDAVYNAAADCLKRGYPVWHAVLTIRDWNACHPPAMDLIEMAETITKAYKTAPIDPPTDLGDAYLRLSEHCSDTIQPRPWLVPGMLPAGQRTALVGKWGTGKSWLALDLAMSIVFGSSFLGDTLPSARGPVVILDGEGGGPRAITRFNQLRIGRGIPSRSHLRHTDIHWYSLQNFNLSWDDAASKLSKLLSPIQPVLVIMDTLAKVLGMPDENSNAAASRVTRALYELNQETSAALLLLAHPAKTQSGDATVRGAGELSADLDVLWNILPASNGLREARCEKDRDPDLHNSTFEFSIDPWKTGTRLTRRHRTSQSDTSDEAMLEALKDASRGLTRSDLAIISKEACALGRSKTLRSITRLLAAGTLKEIDHRLYLANPPQTPV